MWVLLGLPLAVPAPGGGHSGTCVSLTNHEDMIYTVQLSMGTPAQVARDPHTDAHLLACPRRQPA